MDPMFRRAGLGFLWMTVFILMMTGCQSTRKFTSAEVAVLKDAGFVEIEDGESLSLEGRILFDYQKYELSDESRAVVTKIVKALKQLRIDRVRVEGHADRSGSSSYNNALSLRRAEIVAKEMAALGMEPSKISVRGLGSKHPVAENKTNEGRAQNRRAVIIVPAY